MSMKFRTLHGRYHFQRVAYPPSPYGEGVTEFEHIKYVESYCVTHSHLQRVAIKI